MSNRFVAPATPWRRTALSLALAACWSSPLLANPVGPQVVHGQATITSQGATTTIVNTPGTIINWQGFSIGSGEVTQFVQQGASSAVLNRVVGSDPSAILGSLLSNGQVYLINPNGIVFGGGARVDVAGLVASTLNLSDQDFLKGKLDFSTGGSAGSIQNQGLLSAAPGGNIYLVAPSIENSGIIRSPDGNVILAAGHSVKLVDGRDPALQVVVSAPADQAVNLGQIVARSGQVGIYGALVQQSGSISADSAVREGGRILLKASGNATLAAGSSTTADGSTGGQVSIESGGLTSVAGQVSALGRQDSGGQVQVLGPGVHVQDGASLDVSGRHGGGKLLVGGDYQGANPAIANAQATQVDGGASLKADAIESGNGGTLVVWSDQYTQVAGSLSARGGALGGNGGLVETSGQYLNTYGARVDAAAPLGAAGTWLLDPINIEIKDSSYVPDSLGYFDASGHYVTTTTAPSSIVCTDCAGGLNATLNAGTSVVLDSSQGSGGVGDINVYFPITWTSGATLSLLAAGSINVNAGGSITGAGSLVADAVGGISVYAPIQTQGDINLRAQGAVGISTFANLSSEGGTVYLTAANPSGYLSINSPVYAPLGRIVLTGPMLYVNGDVSARGLELHADNLYVGSTVQVTATGPAETGDSGVSFHSLSNDAIMVGGTAGAWLTIDPTQLSDTPGAGKIAANTFNFYTGATGSVGINSAMNLGVATLNVVTGSLTLAGNVTAGSIRYQADLLNLGAAVSTATDVNGGISIGPTSLGATILVDTTPQAGTLWIDASKLDQFVGHYLHLGRESSTGLALNTGDILINAPITGSTATFLNLGLTTQGNIVQAATAPITLPAASVDTGLLRLIGGNVDLSTATNSVSYLESRGDSLKFLNGRSLVVGQDFGVETNGGDVKIQVSGGDLVVKPPGIDACGSTAACTSQVTLEASGSIQIPLVLAGSQVNLVAGGDVIDGDGAANNIVGGNPANPVGLYYDVGGHIDLDAWGATQVAGSSAGSSSIRWSSTPPVPPEPPVPPVPPAPLPDCLQDPAAPGCLPELPASQVVELITPLTLAQNQGVQSALVAQPETPSSVDERRRERDRQAPQSSSNGNQSQGRSQDVPNFCSN